MAQITVNVTAQHIAQGVPDDAGRCAVALALKEATGNPRAWAGYRLFGLADDNPDTWSDTPPHVWAWMDRYDNGDEVEPFTFTAYLFEA